MPVMPCEIRIGTSGYHYKHWNGPFYPSRTPPAKMLAFYVQHFDTVELNNTFYRLPQELSFDVWRRSTPANFVFALKASRYLTHLKKLKDPEPALQNLLPRILRLRSKLGPILFQLPPHWPMNYERLKVLLELLPHGFRYVFELRDHSWIKPEITDLLARFQAAFCIYELAGYQSPLIVTTDFAYVRLHGPTLQKYQGSYNRTKLRRWANQIGIWSKSLDAVYVYFDNDQSGFATRNALTLKRMVLATNGHHKKRR